MTTEPFLAREPTAAEIARWEAEAEKLRAEARKAAAEAAEAEHKAVIARINLEREQQKRDRERWADNYTDRVFRFLDTVGESSVERCMSQLNAWHREDPTCEMTIVFDSPGGTVIEGFHLFDHILDLRGRGHRVVTMSRGYAASMAGILLQAGDWRIMGPNAHLMLHEVSFGAVGKLGEVEDTVEFAKMLQRRALDIFASRCATASDVTATRRLTRRQIERRWKRKDFWVSAQDALAYGLVDEVS